MFAHARVSRSLTPQVFNSTITLAEYSPVGTPVGAPLGAGLPLTPQVSWAIISGATNTRTNQTAFTISTCNGQISVNAAVLDFSQQPVYALKVLAYIQNALYSSTPQTLITVTIKLAQVRNFHV